MAEEYIAANAPPPPPKQLVIQRCSLCWSLNLRLTGTKTVNIRCMECGLGITGKERVEEAVEAWNSLRAE
jgi:DNA-directed RNA polymerase subunit RPC12/RpoP